MAKANYLKRWKRQNPAKVRAASQRYRDAHREEINIRQRAARRNDKRRFMVTQKRSRAKHDGVEFSLTVENLVWPETCPVLGILLDYDSRWPMADNAPTLDRLNPTKGYTPQNTKVISWRANRIKANATLSEIMALAAWMQTQQEGAS